MEQLRDDIERRYGVVYPSKPSYDDLLKAGGLSGHQTQAMNPQRDDAQVLQKREEIQKKLAEHEAEIKSGERIVLAEDECHWVGGDVIGSVWCRQNERTEIPIENIQQRQTYYGAMNRYTQEFILMPYATGNGENTVSFIEHWQILNPNKKFLLLWDGARYHSSQEVQAYLNTVNPGLEEKDWKVGGLLFAPHAPEQNPVEEVWLQGKNFLRRHFYDNKTFQQVKGSFFNFLNKKVFNFEKPHWYLIPQPE